MMMKNPSGPPAFPAAVIVPLPDLPRNKIIERLDQIRPAGFLAFELSK
jgi:hypothetical protein